MGRCPGYGRLRISVEKRGVSEQSRIQRARRCRVVRWSGAPLAKGTACRAPTGVGSEVLRGREVLDQCSKGANGPIFHPSSLSAFNFLLATSLLPLVPGVNTPAIGIYNHSSRTGASLNEQN